MTVETKILSSSFATWKYQRSMLPRFHSAISFYEKGFLWAEHKLKTFQIFYIHFNSKIFCKIEGLILNFKPSFLNLGLLFLVFHELYFELSNYDLYLHLYNLQYNLKIILFWKSIVNVWYSHLPSLKEFLMHTNYAF